jgi:hypothetical protein
MHGSSGRRSSRSGFGNAESVRRYIDAERSMLGRWTSDGGANASAEHGARRLVLGYLERGASTRS